MGSIDHRSLAQKNVIKAQRLMKEKSLDAIIANRLDNFRFLTAYRPMVSLGYINRFTAVLTQEMKFPVILPREVDVEDIKENYPWFEDIRGTQLDISKWPSIIAGVIREYNVERSIIGLDPYTPTILSEKLRKKLPNATFVDAGKVLEEARAIKSEDEINVIRKVVRIAEKGMEAAIAALKPGITEQNVAAAGTHALIDAGVEMPAVSYMVASGINSAISKEVPTNKKIERGDAVIIDGGAYWEGYYAEYARTVFVGEPSSELRRIHKVVWKAEQEAIEMLLPNVHSHEVDKVARKVIRQSGYGKFEHQSITGHGIGLSPHEVPLIGKLKDTKSVALKAGMVINIEPGIYKPSVGGVRLEDTILVTDKKPEVLTKTKNLIIVESV